MGLIFRIMGLILRIMGLIFRIMGLIFRIMGRGKRAGDNNHFAIGTVQSITRTRKRAG